MTISAPALWRAAPKLLLSAGVSAALLALLIHFTLSSAEPALWSSLMAVLSAFSWGFVLLYLLASLVRTLLQALRYRVLIQAAEQQAPALFHMLLVTLGRNMFVDMFPARLGELSYIAMLNRGYQVSGRACVSSLAISFVFDLVALGVLIGVLLLVQLVSGDAQGWMLGVLIVLSGIIATLFVLMYPALRFVNRFIDRIHWLHTGFLKKITGLLRDIEDALQQTRNAGITKRVVGLSLGIRAAKYFGLYCLFVGVVWAQYPEMTTKVGTVLAALISAEAGASLPVPAFMGFGTYEAGGTLALVALGASKATSLIVMLAMHVISQIIDYLLGTIGLIMFLLRTQTVSTMGAKTVVRRPWPVWLLLAVMVGAGLLFLMLEVRAVKKRGAIRPPDQGQAVVPANIPGVQILGQMKGFLVWSSNRSGNHDIWLMSLPDRKIRQITTHPHSEYYPRISPDGKQVVFARSHEPWVSQRNIYAWGVWLLDLKSGKERLISERGNLPTWSADGKSVYFQRHGNEVVQFDLRKNREEVVFKSGVNVKVPPKTALETPDISSRGKKLAVTLRNTMRATAVVNSDGAVQKVGKGCQLSWAPKDRFLYKIDKGGKMENAIFKIDPKSLQAEKWFDYPGEFSHEYFPRVANTSDVLVYGASAGGHEHDTADYEIFLWIIGQPNEKAIRITHHTGNDAWPDVFLYRSLQ